MGQFIGRSDQHDLSTGLIHDLLTNLVSAKFHCVYDHHFSTVRSDYTADYIPVPPAFHNLFQFSTENDYDPKDV